MGVECCSIMERGVSLVVFCETRRLTCASSSWHVIIPWSSLYRKRRSRRVRRQLRETDNGNLDTAKAVSGGPEEKRCLYIDRNLVWTRSIRLLLEWQVPFHTTEAYSSWGIQSVLNSFRNELGDRKSRENLHTAPRERRARRVSWSTCRRESYGAVKEHSKVSDTINSRQGAAVNGVRKVKDVCFSAIRDDLCFLWIKI